MIPIEQRFHELQQRITRADPAGRVTLLAVSKSRSAEEIAALATLGQRHFGENYLKEAVAKQRQLASVPLVWHYIGPIQSNKCRDIARHFAWVHSVDRDKLLPALSRASEDQKQPLNVCLQVNIDDEASKSGCHPDRLPALAAAVEVLPALRLRGLMAIPRPWPDPAQRGDSFRRVAALFAQLRQNHPEMDTLSLGMSDDFELAIASGSTLVRVGTALFGPRGTGSTANPSSAGDIPAGSE